MLRLPETKTILTEFKSGWLTISFNTPENRNALSKELSAELRSVLETVRDDRHVRGITLRGEGGIFCAGGDLKAFSLLTNGGTQEQIKAINKEGGKLFQFINTMPQVVIVLIEGAAIAGGLGIACCADIVVATREAKFSLTETQIGIAPAQIAPYIVHRVGLPRARRLMLTGARFNGNDAHDFGIADYVCDDRDELRAIEFDIQKSVLRCAPGANAITKEIVLAAEKMSAEEMIDFAADRFAQCMANDEGHEGITSFIQKRKPRWAVSPESQN